MRVAEFDFELPEERIALRPASPRDAARLLVVRPGAALEDRHVRDLPELLRPGDTLVFNDTKVIPGQLRGRRERDGHVANIVVTLIERIDDADWWALAKPGKRLSVGDRIRFGHEQRVCLLGSLEATVMTKAPDGRVRLAFEFHGAYLDEAIEALGDAPLPPYIAQRRAADDQDLSDYQTVYAAHEGAVAAPTAGLHFTPRLLERLKDSGIGREFVTLHVGPGTFLPVKVGDTAGHRMHPERGTLDAETAERLNAVRRNGGRIVAVGTTALRLLESAADEEGTIHPFDAATNIFITPGYRFRAVDLLMTNFHLPRSTLFMLVAAFSGLDTMRRAYAHAIELRLSLLFLRRRLAALSRSGRVSGFPFTIAATDGAARCGRLSTPRGEIRTPAFMPVGTQATVKTMYPEQVRALGADIVLGNTYHLMLRPGAERVARLGGLHDFMCWPYPILTDSGGFQVMSLANLRKVDADGVSFRSHIDGSEHRLTPERSIGIQLLLDSDIVMQLDECIALPATPEEIERAMRLSLAWGERSKNAFGAAEGKALFGIVQGGDIPALRLQSAEGLVQIGFDGYAVGGLAVGEPQATMLKILDETAPALPSDKPRYLMGVGTPDDILQSVARGIDMFDCVLPTRAGRHGLAYTRFGKLNMKNARHADDKAPIDAESACPAARDYSRGYIHHLVKAGEALGAMLLTWNNLAYYQTLMAAARAAITAGRYADHVAETTTAWERTEEAA